MKTIHYCMLSLIILCVLPFTGSAQKLTTWDQVTLYTFEEFENTFNGNFDQVEPLQKYPDLLQIPRNKFIKILYNPAIQVGRESADALGEYLTQWGLYASPENTVAEATLCYTDAKGKEVDIVLHLQEVASEQGNHWIVKDAQSPIFFVGDSEKNGIIGITNNEVSFLEFAHNAGSNPCDIAGEKFKADNVTLFLYLTANGLLKYKHTTSTCYYITLGEYRIKVGQIIEKDKAIGGWLILEVYKNNKKVFG
ncbi:MAG: hypothetical protein IJ417_03850 [Bacteroidaceae bacterium]|nr:hypothetical protein [Bacteroidaceae bacterium]